MSLSCFLARRGAISSLAATLGVAHTTIMRWRDGQVPVEHLADVAAVTGIPAAQLRPDLAAMFAPDATNDSAKPTASGVRG